MVIPTWKEWLAPSALRCRRLCLGLTGLAVYSLLSPSAQNSDPCSSTDEAVSFTTFLFAHSLGPQSLLLAVSSVVNAEPLKRNGIGPGYLHRVATVGAGS
ncbi:unnamed protein product [Rangifer tarandus platyrhynchus]|uniref:Uncharacterized protein n=2 Tax=Rangifer tarandus platyrhynchus TaxID=3082113 RepID=A0AC59YNC7_RANTA|nr:unnamed protein product [Rangifer tarandus platyrhynchus]